MEQTGLKYRHIFSEPGSFNLARYMAIQGYCWQEICLEFKKGGAPWETFKAI